MGTKWMYGHTFNLLYRNGIADKLAKKRIISKREGDHEPTTCVSGALWRGFLSSGSWCLLGTQQQLPRIFSGSWQPISCQPSTVDGLGPIPGSMPRKSGQSSQKAPKLYFSLVCFSIFTCLLVLRFNLFISILLSKIWVNFCFFLFLVATYLQRSKHKKVYRSKYRTVANNGL